MTLQEAVQLAPEHNRDIRIASYTVIEDTAREADREELISSSIRNDSSFLPFDRHAVD
jgi:hypothetical protein